MLVGQALRDGLRTRAQIEAFVADLRAGAAEITDDVAQGRDKSLAASLAYGFTHAFTDHDRAQLALLHLFQGFVNVDALHWMGNPETEHCLSEVRGLTRETGITLLDRAAEIGLLSAVGDGFYAIHPALPLYFQRLFTDHYDPPRATRAYVEGIRSLVSSYKRQYDKGHAELIDVLRAEEANLLHARELAHTHGWWPSVIEPMQGLLVLYGHTGRTSEWKRLVDELTTDLVDPATGGPLPGREEEWSFVTDYLARLARDARDFATAERLGQLLLAWHQQRAASALAAPAEKLDDEQRHRLRALAVSLEFLGSLLVEQARSECIGHFKGAIQIYQRIGERRAEASVAICLGHALKTSRVCAT